MSDPEQAITFGVFETNPVKGNISYTNFEYADPGSGVWVPGATTNLDSSLSLGSFSIGFGLGADPTIVSTYDFTIADVTPLSPTSLSFTGNGVQQFGPWSGPVTGTISGSTLTFMLLEQNGAESYTLNATGQIDANGAVAGTWSDNYTDPARTGTFSIADVGDEVFSFTTTPTCVEVDTEIGVARFGYTIPAEAPVLLAGKPVAVSVEDNGTPGTGDLYWHNFAVYTGSCLPNQSAYEASPITAGNLTVFG